jgi:hypothetical protein
MNLGYPERESYMHWLEVDADMMRTVAAFRRASSVKNNGVGFEKRMSSGHSNR